MIPNTNYNNLKDSYLFYHIAQKTGAYLEEHPGARLYRMGIGDVSRPLCGAVIRALHEAVEDQAKAATFHGYMPECGDPALRRRIAEYYRNRGVSLLPEEVFVSSGASDELGDILDLFGRDKTVLIMEPAYPAYVDANVMAGNRILHLPSGKENGFLPVPDPSLQADIIYLCSPNNPTGAVFDCEKLKVWVDYANANGAVILYDSAYEAFITEEDVPHTIFEIEGARTCAIEFRSYSKTAGFTGNRCAYTVVPMELKRDGASLNALWNRRQCTKFNGVPYVIQRGAAAIYTPEGKDQTRASIDYYRQNAQVIREGLTAAGLSCFGGVNAPYIWIKTPDGMGSWDFFDLLLDRANVATTPGAGFGPSGEGYVRLTAFGGAEATREAVERIKAML